MDIKLKTAIKIVRREMHSYDAMAQAPRYRRVESQYQIHQRESQNLDVDAPQRCAHGEWLHEPCLKCKRAEGDCLVYKQAMLCRLKELLKSV